MHWSWQDATKIELIHSLLEGQAGKIVSGLKIGDEVETKNIPNQGIWSSARNAILIGLFAGLVGGLIGGLVGGLIGGLGGGIAELKTVENEKVRWSWQDATQSGLGGGLVFGLGLGLAIGLIYGGLVIVQHFTLRLMLYRNGSIPLNYVRFLDYCAERIFLRKVGGGYIFVHRLLMEHFAGIESLKH